MVKIQGIISEHPDNKNYGVRRMRAALAQKGTHVSLRTVYRTMSEAGLIHRHRRPHGITKADTETQNRENLIKRNFSAGKPLKKLLTDITEVQCADGKLYVSPILDCFNGEIVALVMRENMKKEICIDTVKQLHEKYDRQSFTATEVANIQAMRSAGNLQQMGSSRVSAVLLTAMTTLIWRASLPH